MEVLYFIERALQICVVLLYLAVCGCAGCAVRIYLGLLFGSACENPSSVSWFGSWVPCITNDGKTTSGGALFIDLISNMVGSFFMGLLQRGAQLGLNNDLPLAFLPANSALQKSSELQLGLRTGFCGSLTTFASWNNQMVIMACGGYGTVQSTQWLAAIVGYIIGMELALCSLHLGRHLAILLHHVFNPQKLAEAESFSKNATDYQINVRDFEARFLDDNLTQEELDKAKSIGLELEQLQKWKESASHVQDGGPRLSFDKLSFVLRVQGKLLQQHELHVEEDRLASELGLNADVLRQWVESTAHLREQQSSRRSSKSLPPKDFQSIARSSLIHLPVLFLYIAVNAALVAGIILDDEDTTLSTSRRARYCAILLAPFGVALRWELSNFNGKLQGSLSWFPLGTFLANMVACVIDAVLSAVNLHLTVRNGQVSYWISVWFPAVITGFSGSLSTVSTFVAEINALMFSFPEHLHAYTYMVLSLVTACTLGIALYGWSAW